MHLMDVVTLYLYGSLDNDIYMKVLEGFKIPETYKSSSQELCSIKLQRSLYYILKQSWQMWYNHLNEYLLKEGVVANHLERMMRWETFVVVSISLYLH